MKNKKVVISFSGGKDSMLSLYRMLKDGYDVIGLISTFDNQNDTCFHRIPGDILEEVSKSLNIPLIKVNCSKEKNYEYEFEKALNFARENGAEFCVFGDIDIDSHRKWGCDRCKAADINAIFPLWNEERETLVNEFLDYGFKAIIKKVNLKSLDKEFLGKILSKDIINEVKLCGADPCGENGEYHTFVFDGPIFLNKINFTIVNRELIDDYGYLTIRNNN